MQCAVCGVLIEEDYYERQMNEQNWMVVMSIFHIKSSVLFVVLLSVFSPFLIFNVVLADERTELDSTELMQQLSKQEREWLKGRDSIRVGFMNSWAPISFVDDNGLPQGLAIDYIQYIDQKLGSKVELIPGSWDELVSALKSRKIDVLLDFTERPSRKKFTIFTQPYLKTPHIIVINTKASWDENKGVLSGKVVALEKGFGNIEHFREHYPDALIHQFLNTKEALEAVALGHADAYVGNRAVAIYLINQNIIPNLKIYGRFDKPDTKLSMGVRSDWPVLHSILNKSLASISISERNKLHDKWIQLNILDSYDFKKYHLYVVTVAGFVLLLILWSLYSKLKLNYFRDRVYRLANFDALTGLANGYLFNDRLNNALTRARQDRNLVLVVVCKIYGLENVRKVHGNRSVNSILKKMADTLQSMNCLSSAACLSENTFSFFVVGLKNNKEIEAVSNSIIKSLSPIEKEMQNGRLDMFYGASVYPRDGLDVEEIMVNAKLALKEASKQDINNFVFFNPDLNLSIKRQLEVDAAMTNALSNGEFDVFFQPKISIDDKRIHSFEALLRWNNDSIGNIGPDEFIPIAESNGQILSIGRFVIEESFKAAASWNQSTESGVSVAINVSPIQFKDPGLINFMTQQLHSVGLSPELVEIEITEGVLISENIEVDKLIFDLKEVGFKLSLDDFGKGYSSLSYLKRYPFDVLKIDKEFIDDLETNESNRYLVRSILAMSQSFNIKVVAEGVETKQQLEILAKQKCDIAQGYYFSKAVDKEAALDFVHNNDKILFGKF